MLDSKIISTLKSSIRGKIITPADEDYDQARIIFYGGMDKKPAVIIQVANAQDIQKVVEIATQADLELAIRSGGHSFAGYSSVDDGIVIDLRAMKKIQINAAEKTVWAETGVTAAELTQATDKHNLAVGFGDTGSVGIGGITLGGGVGFLVRKFGLAIDNLLTAELVTAAGEVIQVDENNHPDLFWAIRGGGGNFGVVTKFKFQLHDLAEVMGGILLLPAESKVLAKFMDQAATAPEELSVIVNVMPAPPMPMVPPDLHGKLCIMALVMYAGNPDQGEKILAPFRQLTKPWADLIKPMRYKDIFFPEDQSYHPTAVAQTMMVDHIDVSLAEKIIHQLESLKSPSMRVVQLRTLGGAMAKIPTDGTAFAHRQSKIMANVAAFYETEAEKVTRSKWVDQMVKLLFQKDDGVYVGFLGLNDQAKIKQAYPGKTLAKLQKIKQSYDPENLFHHNFNY